MLITLFIVAVFFVILFKSYQEYQKMVNTIEETRKVYKDLEEKKLPVRALALTGILGVAAIIAGIVLIMKPDLVGQKEHTLYVTFLLCLGVYFLTMTYMSTKIDTLYYNETGFIYRDRFIKYRLVKGIDLKNYIKPRVDVTLFDGTKFTLSREYAEVVNENRKMGRKEK